MQAVMRDWLHAALIFWRMEISIQNSSCDSANHFVGSHVTNNSKEKGVGINIYPTIIRNDILKYQNSQVNIWDLVCEAAHMCTGAQACSMSPRGSNFLCLSSAGTISTVDLQVEQCLRTPGHCGYRTDYKLMYNALFILDYLGHSYLQCMWVPSLAWPSETVVLYNSDTEWTEPKLTNCHQNKDMASTLCWAAGNKPNTAQQTDLIRHIFFFFLEKLLSKNILFKQ